MTSTSKNVFFIAYDILPKSYCCYYTMGLQEYASKINIYSELTLWSDSPEAGTNSKIPELQHYGGVFENEKETFDYHKWRRDYE